MTSVLRAENTSKNGWLSRVEKLFLGLSLFLLPWQWRHLLAAGTIGGQYFEYGSTYLYASDVAILILLILWLINARDKRVEVGPAIIFKPLLVLVVWLVASVWWADNFWLGAGVAGHWLLGLGWFLYLINRVENVFEVLWPLLTGIVFQAFWGILQFGLNSSLSFLLAKDIFSEPSLDPAKAGVPVVIVDGVRQLRAHGMLPHANVFGGLMVFGGSTVLHLSRQFKVWWWTIPVAGALVLSFSRGAWLAFGIILLVVMVAMWSKGSRNWQTTLGVLVLTLLAVGGWQHTAIFNRFDLQRPLEERSIGERVASLSVWQNVAGDDFVHGVGVGNYTQHLATVFPDHDVWWYQPVHNIYLLIVGETGVVGLAMMLWLVWGVSVIGWRVRRLDPTQLILFTPLLAWLTIGVFDHWPISLQQGRLMFFVATALIILVFNVSLKEIKGRG